MNTEIKTVNRFEKAGFNGEQSKSMVVGIDDLLVKSMAAFREYFDHRFETIDHRINALESSVRSSHTQINVLIGIQFALAGLLVATLVAVLFGSR